MTVDVTSTAPGSAHLTLRGPAGRHTLPTRSRMKDFEAAFGHSSPLHQRGLHVVVSRGAVDRLRSLLQRRALP